MRALAGPILVAALLGPGCRKAKPAPSPLDVVPVATAHPGRLAAGGPAAVDCEFRVGSSAPRVTGDYRVFVHLVDDEGSLLAADDYPPSPPVAEWQPGGRYARRRILLTPEFPYAGRVSILTGLYSERGGERLALTGKEQGRRAYRSGGFALLPRRGDLALDWEGLYEPEASADAPLLSMRFMGEAASCRFANPGEDVLLFLSVDIEPQGFAVPPRLTIEARAGRRLELTLPLTTEPELLRVRVPGTALGRREQATLRFAMSASYVPSALGVSGDTRRLSLRIRGASLLRAAGLDPALAEGAIELAAAQ